MDVIIVTPQGVARILDPDEYLAFVQVRMIKGGFYIRRIKNFPHPARVDDKVLRMIREIENSMAKENFK